LPGELVTANNIKTKTTNICDKDYKIGIINSHYESGLHYIEAFYESIGYNCDSIDERLTMSVIEKYSLLLIGSHGLDWYASELAVLREFLKAGGNVAFLGIIPNYSLLPFLAENGMDYFYETEYYNGYTNITTKKHPLMKGINKLYIEKYYSLKIQGPAIELFSDQLNNPVSAAAAVGDGLLIGIFSDFNYLLEIPDCDNKKLLQNIIYYEDILHELSLRIDRPADVLTTHSLYSFNITVFNTGEYAENIVLDIKINDRLIKRNSYSILESKTNLTLSFNWRPTRKGNYSISVEVYPVQNELITDNNIVSINQLVLEYHNFNVGILNADWSERPSYFYQWDWDNNYEQFLNQWALSGVKVYNITNNDIVNGALDSIDVLVLIGNVPSISTMTYIRKWYNAGGNILSLDKSIAFLNYAGFLPKEANNTDGYLDFWGDNSYYKGLVTDVVHPILYGYKPEQVLIGEWHWAYYYHPEMTDLYGSNYTCLVSCPNQLKDFVAAYNPGQNGRIVHSNCDEPFYYSDYELLTLNALMWLGEHCQPRGMSVGKILTIIIPTLIVVIPTTTIGIIIGRKRR
jgi:hypothetical protein